MFAKYFDRSLVHHGLSPCMNENVQLSVRRQIRSSCSRLTNIDRHGVHDEESMHDFRDKYGGEVTPSSGPRDSSLTIFQGGGEITRRCCYLERSSTRSLSTGELVRGRDLSVRHAPPMPPQLEPNPPTSSHFHLHTTPKRAPTHLPHRQLLGCSSELNERAIIRGLPLFRPPTPRQS